MKNVLINTSFQRTEIYSEGCRNNKNKHYFTLFSFNA